MRASVVIRTLNEARYLPVLLAAIERQRADDLEVEVVVVDSGSTDGTVEIAEQRGAKLVRINKSEFSFGRSLNLGCEASSGDYLVLISGHCIPADELWLSHLVRPLATPEHAYAYGRQIGHPTSRFSERQIFRKYFPETSQVPQSGFFVNNANAALRRDLWARFPFDEEVTGLEDMELGKRIVEAGYRICYLADATVYHLHHEGWRQIRWRYEREAIALQKIMPDVHLSFTDFARYLTSAVLLDVGAALQTKQPAFARVPEICAFRLMQFWGSYRGNRDQRRLSRRMKERYFYPR